MNKEVEMKLTDYGFVEVGKWKLSETLKNGVAFELHALEKERVVYAFVVDDKAKYVGICQSKNKTLAGRMMSYRNLAGGGTTKRVANKIKDSLTEGKTVRIFALKPEQSFSFRGLNVDLIKGLENPLICALKVECEWNKQK